MNKKIFASIFCINISLFAMDAQLQTNSDENSKLIEENSLLEQNSDEKKLTEANNSQLLDSNTPPKTIKLDHLQPTSSNETQKQIELNLSSPSSSIVPQSRSTPLLISSTYDPNDAFLYSSELVYIKLYQKNQILIQELLNRDASENLEESLSCLVATNLELIKIIKCYSLTGYQEHYQKILNVNQQILTKILENNHLKDDNTGMFSEITSQNKIFIEILSDIENNKVTFLDMPPSKSNTSLTPSPDGL